MNRDAHAMMSTGAIGLTKFRGKLFGGLWPASEGFGHPKRTERAYDLRLSVSGEGQVENTHGWRDHCVQEGVDGAQALLP